jgi:hypothetical protein
MRDAFPSVLLVHMRETRIHISFETQTLNPPINATNQFLPVSCWPRAFVLLLPKKKVIKTRQNPSGH